MSSGVAAVAVVSQRMTLILNITRFNDYCVFEMRKYAVAGRRYRRISTAAVKIWMSFWISECNNIIFPTYFPFINEYWFAKRHKWIRSTDACCRKQFRLVDLYSSPRHSYINIYIETKFSYIKCHFNVTFLGHVPFNKLFHHTVKINGLRNIEKKNNNNDNKLVN